MPSEQDILGLLTGTLPAEQRARVADELARDPEAGRRAFGAERLAALAVLLGHVQGPGLPPAASPIIHSPRPPNPAVSADEVLRDAIREAGADGWAYRPPKDSPAPGVAAVVRAAVQEWSRTWHARLLILACALALAYAGYALLQSGPPVMHPRTGGGIPPSGPTDVPKPGPVPSSPPSRP